MGVVGFDEIPWASLARPSLSTVAQLTYEMGKTAGELLTTRLVAPGRPAETVVLRTALNLLPALPRPSSSRADLRLGSASSTCLPMRINLHFSNEWDQLTRWARQANSAFNSHGAVSGSSLTAIR
jgi:hypothetical protein